MHKGRKEGGGDEGRRRRRRWFGCSRSSIYAIRVRASCFIVRCPMCHAVRGFNVKGPARSGGRVCATKGRSTAHNSRTGREGKRKIETYICTSGHDDFRDTYEGFPVSLPLMSRYSLIVWTSSICATARNNYFHLNSSF